MTTTSKSGTRLAGRTAIVTGSGQNIGRAIALAFAADGANVVVNGHRNAAALDDVVAEIKALGAKAIPVLADVGDPKAVQAMVERAVEAFGTVDIAVSNVSRRLHAPFLDITIEEWQGILNSNLSASFYLARSTIPLMQKGRWGRIIHISGRDGFAPAPNRAHNVVAKAGMFALAKAIGMEHGPDGITANAVAPGIIDTTRDAAQYPDFQKRYAARRDAMPARRFGKAEEIGAACAYLASDDAGFINGQVLHVNGGEFMF